MEMIQINLLPKEFRKKSSTFSIGKAGLYAGGVFAGIIIMISIITFYQIHQLSELDKKIEIAKFRTKQLEKDIMVVDALIDVKEKLMKRVEAVDQLDQHRTAWVRILEDFSRQLPEFMWLSKLTEEEAVVSTDTLAPALPANTKGVQIEGFSFTLSSLANFMINMMRSDYFSDVEMASVEEVEFDKHKAYNYTINATLHYLSDSEIKELLASQSGPRLLAGF